MVGNFVEEQKGINVQLAQRIDTVESTLNKRIDGLESNLNQKNLQYSITKINKLLEVQERGRFPSQTLPNPKGVHEVGSSSNSGMDEVKSIITLRSGREIEQPVPMAAEETCKKKEAEPERIIISKESMKHCMPPPFPQALRSKKKASQQAGISAGRHPRSPKAGEGQHTPYRHHQTSPCLCKVFERSLYNQKGIGH